MDIVDGKIPYDIRIKDVYDNELYSVSTENSCGVIIFPDSMATPDNIVFISIKPEEYRYDLNVINFSRVIIKPRNKADRLTILKELQACSSIASKIEKLNTHHATLDILSLLELEKMKDPQNKAIDKLYWEIVSQIRYEFSNRAWER